MSFSCLSINKLCFLLTEEIVMTPTKKGRTTIIALEKKRKQEIDSTQVVHQGGGAHSGLVISKQSDRESHYYCVSDIYLRAGARTQGSSSANRATVSLTITVCQIYISGRGRALRTRHQQTERP